MKRGEDEIATRRRWIRTLYDFIGADHGICKYCGVDVWWAVSKTGHKAPFNQDGLIHFADCPNAAEARRKRKASGGKR